MNSISILWPAENPMTKRAGTNQLVEQSLEMRILVCSCLRDIGAGKNEIYQMSRSCDLVRQIRKTCQSDLKSLPVRFAKLVSQIWKACQSDSKGLSRRLGKLVAEIRKACRWDSKGLSLRFERLVAEIGKTCRWDWENLSLVVTILILIVIVNGPSGT